MSPRAHPIPTARSVCVVASGGTGAALRRAIEAHPSLRLHALAARFTDLVVDPGFPGEAVLLAEEPSRALFAHAQTAIAAGALVVVHADVDEELAAALEGAGADVVPLDRSAEEVADLVAAARQQRRRVSHVSDTATQRPRLSHSERRALAHYVQGLTTVQVATEMGVGYETAKTFLRRVRAKYAAVDRSAGKRAQLILRAEEDGIL